MGVLDAILTTEVLHGIVIIAVLAFTVRTLLIHSRESSTLQPKFDSTDRNLKQIRDGMAGKKNRIAELTKKVDPLQLRFDQMSALYESGKKIEDDDERDAAQNEEEQEGARKRRVQRKKMGFSSDDYPEANDN